MQVSDHCDNGWKKIKYMVIQILIVFLFSSGFYGPDNKSIIEYAANVDVVFSNKACAHLLERARELMTRPVHVTVSVTPLEPEGPLIIQVNLVYLLRYLFLEGWKLKAVVYCN